MHSHINVVCVKYQAAAVELDEAKRLPAALGSSRALSPREKDQLVRSMINQIQVCAMYILFTLPTAI